jgi:hypothetical protein
VTFESAPLFEPTESTIVLPDVSSMCQSATVPAHAGVAPISVTSATTHPIIVPRIVPPLREMVGRPSKPSGAQQASKSSEAEQDLLRGSFASWATLQAAHNRLAEAILDALARLSR